VVRLKPAVLAGLARHGIAPEPDDAPETLRERLNDAYLQDVRRLRRRQVAGEIPLREYSAHVQGLKESYPLLGLPLGLWTE
jgi:hypothetical protein